MNITSVLQYQWKIEQYYLPPEVFIISTIIYICQQYKQEAVQILHNHFQSLPILEKAYKYMKLCKEEKLLNNLVPTCKLG